ncbi:hypothetical protein BZG36_01406 [Bifiguratus adelaidae]|uniref:DEP domain-containing protein n=1 Tax=Bifiguratus adelaidae TaxID=1938954 RepID=A0A261Y4X2_9FUNG|nr:hypothetical protein BZG36_01406 [Bifiguratus adelaidae]
MAPQDQSVPSSRPLHARTERADGATLTGQLKLAKTGVPAFRDMCVLFSALVIVLPLTTHRHLIKHYNQTFTYRDALSKLRNLSYSKVTRQQDPTGSSRMIATTSTTTFKMTEETALELCQLFLEARFWESATDSGRSHFKDKGLWMLTPKGIWVLERGLEEAGNGPHKALQALKDAYGQPYAHQIFELDREEGTDLIRFSGEMLEDLFRWFCGRCPNEESIALFPFSKFKDDDRTSSPRSCDPFLRHSGEESVRTSSITSPGPSQGFPRADSSCSSTSSSLGDSSTKDLLLSSLSPKSVPTSATSPGNPISGPAGSRLFGTSPTVYPPGIVLREREYFYEVYHQSFTGASALHYMVMYTSALTPREAELCLIYFVRTGWIKQCAETTAYEFSVDPDGGFGVAFRPTKSAWYQITSHGRLVAGWTGLRGRSESTVSAATIRSGKGDGEGTLNGTNKCSSPSKTTISDTPVTHHRSTSTSEKYDTIRKPPRSESLRSDASSDRDGVSIIADGHDITPPDMRTWSRTTSSSSVHGQTSPMASPPLSIQSVQDLHISDSLESARRAFVTNAGLSPRPVDRVTSKGEKIRRSTSQRRPSRGSAGPDVTTSTIPSLPNGDSELTSLNSDPVQRTLRLSKASSTRPQPRSVDKDDTMQILLDPFESPLSQLRVILAYPQLQQRFEGLCYTPINKNKLAFTRAYGQVRTQWNEQVKSATAKSSERKVTVPLQDQIPLFLQCFDMYDVFFRPNAPQLIPIDARTGSDLAACVDALAEWKAHLEALEAANEIPGAPPVPLTLFLKSFSWVHEQVMRSLANEVVPSFLSAQGWKQDE